MTHAVEPDALMRPHSPITSGFRPTDPREFTNPPDLTWRYGHAPAGLVTRRQMRAADLAPGGAEPVAQVVWRHRRHEVRALLWDRAELVTKRVPTPAQLVAVGLALAARRWCPACTRDVGYCLQTSVGVCVDCAFPELAGEPVEVRDAAA